MKQTMPTKPRDWKEGRRFRAWELYQQGWKQCAIAAALGVTPSSVSQWIKRAKLYGGPEALSRRVACGPQSKLTPEQRASLPQLLDRGAPAFGFRGDIWTTKRVAAVIAKEYGVHYHPAHVSRLLRAIGWSPQKPIQRATQRDEEAIRRWVAERWPALKKKPTRKAASSCG